MNARQEKLFSLMRCNDLHLTVADFIELAYHQWCDDYLTIEKCAEHIQGGTNMPLQLCYEVYDCVNLTLMLGKQLYLDSLYETTDNHPR